MTGDYGLYLSLGQNGHIKRDLAGLAGEVSLEDAVIQDELILFSELSFEPYALVVDLICDCGRHEEISVYDGHHDRPDDHPGGGNTPIWNAAPHPD